MINRVFCIDDDQITLTLCELVIKKARFAADVVVAKNGREGLAFFSEFFIRIKKSPGSEEAPGIIFLDLNMPVMNGWDFLEDYLMKYADRIPATKVVILSSTVNPEDFSRANQYDIVIDFINKPLTVEGLSELMESEQVCQYFSKEPT